MRFVVHRDATAFLKTALPWLLEREAENNLILGVALARAQGRPEGHDPAWFGTVEEGGRVLGAVFRTPPHMLGVTAMPTGAAPLVTRMAGQEFDELPGVVGHEDTVQAVADVWAAGHPVRTRLEMRMGIYALQTLVPPARPAPGRILPAKLHSAPLVGWMEGFEEDTGIFSTGPAETVRNLLASDALFVWEDDGEPVAMAGFSGTTPNGVRVGYVYTPPAYRGRGYATGLTAALCRLALDRGSRFCFLYADLNDPVSTGIYRRLGFAQVATARAVRFDPV